MDVAFLEAAAGFVAGGAASAAATRLRGRRNQPTRTLAETRLARLLDPGDDLQDLTLAEIKAVENRGRDHQADVRHGIYRARAAYTLKKRGGAPNG